MRMAFSRDDDGRLVVTYGDNAQSILMSPEAVVPFEGEEYRNGVRLTHCVPERRENGDAALRLLTEKEAGLVVRQFGAP